MMCALSYFCPVSMPSNEPEEAGKLLGLVGVPHRCSTIQNYPFRKMTSDNNELTYPTTPACGLILGPHNKHPHTGANYAPCMAKMQIVMHGYHWRRQHSSVTASVSYTCICFATAQFSSYQRLSFFRPYENTFSNVLPECRYPKGWNKYLELPRTESWTRTTYFSRHC